MNRDAWRIFGGLVIATLVGLLGTVAWQKGREVGALETQLREVRGAAAADAARMAEAWHEVELARSRAETLARDMAAVTNSQQQLEAEMRSALQSRDIAISELRGELTLTILDRILFDSGDATLKPEGTQILDEIAKVLARYTHRQIQVIGHTDNVPIRYKFPSNWELSAARAIAAVRYLTEKAGVDPRRLNAVGCGEFQPIAGNDTAEGRARNRRIALVVLPERFIPTDVDADAALPPLATSPGATETPPASPTSPLTDPIPPVRPPAEDPSPTEATSTDATHAPATDPSPAEAAPEAAPTNPPPASPDAPTAAPSPDQAGTAGSS